MKRSHSRTPSPSPPPLGEGRQDKRLKFEIELKEEWERHPYLSDDSRMDYLLESGVLADTVFLVGEAKTEVKAHRWILEKKSEFFQTLFSERWNSDDEQKGIEIPGVAVDDFRSFLEFMYVGSTSIVTENALPLLYLGRIYQIPDLKDQAVTFLTRNMKCETAVLIHRSMSPFDDNDAVKLTSAAFEFILKNAYNVFERPEMVELSAKDFEKIMKAAFYHPEELKVFQTCLKWARAQLETEDIPNSQETLRSVMKGFVNHIRFPVMSLEDVNMHVIGTGVLEEVEEKALLSYLQTPYQRRVGIGPNEFHDSQMVVRKFFKIKPRTGTKFAMDRFRGFKSSEKSWTYPFPKKADRIRVSESIFIQGIGLYGNSCPDARMDYEVKAVIHAHESWSTRTYAEINHIEPPKKLIDRTGNIFKVCFKNPVHCINGLWYTITIICSGERSFHGIDGYETCHFQCKGYPITFTFKEAIDRQSNEFSSQRLSTNGTGVSKGQIPIIYFTMDDGDDDDVQLVEIC